MADASSSRRAVSAQGHQASLVSDNAGPSHAQESAPAIDAPAHANLPLRRSRHAVGGVQAKMHDITEKFTRASLEVGQLVKDEYFTLFESIGAIEIMDPKMDSGFLQPGETLEDDYDTLTPLLPEELIGIMDQLLCYEMAWHTGYPLSQTLFTSVHIVKLVWTEATVLGPQFYRGEIPEHRRPGPLLEVLRAYCLAVIKGCDFVIAKITGRDYFEEEDFCTHIYNRVLLVSVPIDVFLRELDAAIEVIEDPESEINDGVRKAISARLALRKDYLRALDLDLPLNQTSYCWPPILQGIATLKNTHQLGQSVPGAFSSKMQRRLASTVPPRPIVELDFKDALQKLQHIAADCEEATRFIALPQDPLEYQSFLWHFASRSPPPLAYARAYLSTLLFHPDNLNTSVSLPLSDVKTLVFPASPVLDSMNWTFSPPRSPLLPKPPRLQFAMLMDEFVERTGQPFLDLWVALGQNRCRLRRMLTHVITAWDLLQTDAALIDTDISSAAEELGIGEQVMEFSLSTWVYHKKLWMIEKVVLLGFEQDIYLPDEFAGMYLFLSLIATRRKELLKRVEAHYLVQANLFLTSRKLREAQEIDDAGLYLDSLLAEAEGTASLALALARFYILLLYLGLLPLPKRPFGTEALRYELRMKPFLSLSPPEAPAFEDFRTHTQPYGSPSSPSTAFFEAVGKADSELWAEVDGHVKAAKAAFAEYKKMGVVAAKAEGVEKAWGKEVQSALASCVALGVAVAGVKDMVVKKGMDGGKEGWGMKVEVPEAGTGKRYAEGWVVVKTHKE
ncbi:Mak10-domain-containing protein [Decorospora gaudefroyi]|uniref:Mak10-domain-containing protein n=1 Tax=Decorospora gaudefroyi TaxID=184978 RepID=A0A6A5KG64_9PLEO|nr:Mak10-domain-containing protein [Decorospora gaudefroyi]